jgi:uncharacterized protein (DUF1501 family)
MKINAWLPRLAFAPPHDTTPRDTLIVIFLRGAADALNIIVPHGEAAYYALRPTLSIARPDDGAARAEDRTINLDGFFGLHPAMRPLLPAWQAQQLAIVHACGAPDESRSHFKAMELMERGVNDERGPASGWIGRHLASARGPAQSSLRAVAFGSMTPRSLSGSVPVTALRSITDVHLGGDSTRTRQMQRALNALYAGDSASVTGHETLVLMRALERIDPATPPTRGARYPDSEFGHGLRQAALLVKAQIGVEVAALDLGGWDTHFAQGAASGQMAALLRELAQGLAALHTDLLDHMRSISIVCMSEFGRRAAENGSLGTDHGHGSAMLLLGGAVRGGRVHGVWPGLGDGQLIGPGDLAVTTDYRDVLGELLSKRLGNVAMAEVFPGYAVKAKGVFQ